MEASAGLRKVGTQVGNKSSVLIEADQCSLLEWKFCGMDVVALWNEKEYFAQTQSLLVHLKLKRRFGRNLSNLDHLKSTNFAALHSETIDDYGLEYCKNPRQPPRQKLD